MRGWQVWGARAAGAEQLAAFHGLPASRVRRGGDKAWWAECVGGSVVKPSTACLSHPGYRVKGGGSVLGRWELGGGPA